MALLQHFIENLKQSRRPLLGAVTLVIVAGLLIPSSIGGAVLLNSQYEEMIRRLHADHERLTKTLALSMEAPLWDLDKQSGRMLIGAVMTDTRVVRVVVRDTTGAFSVEETVPERRIGKQFIVDQPIVYQPNAHHGVIGDVLVEMDSGVADASVQRARNTYLAVLAGELLASVGLILWLLNTSLLVPLRKLRAEAQELAKGKLAQPFVWRRADELGDLGNSLESTRRELNVLFGQVEDKNRQLEAQNRELEERVEERTIEVLQERDSLRVAHRNISLLGDIGREITSTLNREEIMHKVYDHASHLMVVDVFGIGLYRPEQNVVDVPYLFEHEHRRTPYQRDMADEHLLGWCITHRSAIMLNDFDREIGTYLSHYDPEQERRITQLDDGSPPTLPESALYAPMIVKDRVLGVVGVHAFKKHAFEQMHLDILATLAAYAAVALDNADAYRQLQEAQTQLLMQEKMAALGQLVAGVAHEINTPIGAVKSSGKNIMDALDHAMANLPRVMHLLNDTEQALFIELLDLGRKPAAMTNSREERAISRELARQLEEAGVEDARQRAGILVQLRAQDAWQRFLPLLHHASALTILDAAYSVATVAMNAANINVAVERVAKIIYALKSFSRFDRTGERVESDLREGVETVLTIYQNKIKQGTELVRDYQAIRPLWCFPDELNQVWTNLIYNALQAMNYKGKLTIGIAEEDGCAVVSVSDTGCGISEDVRQRIFEPFFTTKPAGEGSGLGLDIVKKIIEKHQGRIEVRSEVGVGSTFRVCLPYGAGE
ncbi:MAG: GAF domain-containing protein [Burkholderiales bacterium]|nr:GAF domain-containing protein [Burkholderiales bacterium]